MGLFWLAGAMVVAYAAYGIWERPGLFTLCGLLVSAVALVPTWFWCSGRAPELPIFPVYAVTFVPAFAFPLFEASERLKAYGPDLVWRVTYIVVLFLAVGTVAWRLWGAQPHQAPRRYAMLGGDRGSGVLLLLLFIATAVTVANRAGWLDSLPGGIDTAARSIMRGPSGFAAFVLAMRWGNGKLSATHRAGLVLAFALYCLADASSIFLVGVILACLMLVLGFTFGRGRVPWLLIAGIAGTLSLLHAGKAEMRARYWQEESQGNSLSPHRYPSFYAEWINVSLSARRLQSQGLEEKSSSLLTRANTLYLLLLACESSPESVPFLKGETYWIIPEALIPRFLYSKKVSPHYATGLLNVHYGMQTWEATQSTSIGWGMLNEAFANFGTAGCLGAAMVIASFFGWVGWWCKGLPLGSLRGVVGVFTIGFTLQTEMPAAVFISSYLQGLAGLLLIAWFFSETGSGNDEDSAVGAADHGAPSLRPQKVPGVGYGHKRKTGQG